MEIALPYPVARCLDMLFAAGYKAYAVGGCVRDSLSGREPHDWDVCTDAAPGETQEVFDGMRIIPTGLKHGTVTLMLGGMQIEITALRRDGDYSDRRRPDRVAFTGDITEDLSRRDFTVNAMAYSPREGLIDPFGGRQDLASGILRCVGEPERRFSEDALRILRLFRFVSQLSFSPDPATLAAAGRCREFLRAVSRERVQAELNRILTGPGVYDALCLCCDVGVLSAVIPEFEPCVGFDQQSPYHDRTVDRHIFAAVSYAPPRLEICLALLLHDIGKPAAFTLDETGRGHTKGHAAISRDIAGGILKRLRYPTRTVANVLRLIELHSKKLHAERPALRRLLAGPGPEFVRDMLDLKEADDRAKADVARLRRYPAVRAALEGIIHDGDCLSIADLKINGEDIKTLGIPPGPGVGRALTYLLDLVLEAPARNDRSFLLGKVKELASNWVPLKTPFSPPEAGK